MEESEALIIDSEKLNRPPHVLPQLIDIVSGKLKPSSTEQEQRWQHLAGCIFCQTLAGNYLLEVIEGEEEQDSSREAARKLLAKLTGIMHKTLAEDIPAYAETFIEQGDERARQQFPLLTEHLQTCQTCQSEVQHLHAWLQYVEQARSPQGAEKRLEES